MNASLNESPRTQPLRVVPGVVAVILLWLVWFSAEWIAEGITAAYIGVLGGLAGSLAVVVWWVFFSRAPWLDRLGGVLLIVAGVALTPYFLHESITGMGMGIMFFIYAVPTLATALVAAAVISRNLAIGRRRMVVLAAILLTCLGWTMVRSDGVRGGGGTDFAWRWTATPEEQLLARSGDQTFASPPPSEVVEAGEWPGFRGPQRDGISQAAPIETDWAASPPAELWRRPVGPGWSSFAVAGDVFYTQEQRGETEVVACYRIEDGQPVWIHSDSTRFWEANAGAGPRATPTLRDGRVYTLGATGIVNVLDAADGTLIWSKDAAAETETEVPYWGFAGSPLIIDDSVIVALAGQLAAYDRNSGERLWLGPEGGLGYSSPHLTTIDGVRQVLLLSGTGLVSLAPADGKLLWEHEWPGDGIVQPAFADGDVLLGAGSGIVGETGVRRIAVSNGSGQWSVEERWTSRGLKPYFNDFVIHKGHAYGFDGRILSCISLEDGERQWKGGRYGHGQLVLLPRQDGLLVLSEKGELALVAANADQFSELARVPAIEGKTWNHPVMVDDLVLVRNDREMAAFRLSPAGASKSVSGPSR